MRPRRDLDVLSPRALARLRPRPGREAPGTEYVPTVDELFPAEEAVPPAVAAPTGEGAGRHRSPASRRRWLELPSSLREARWKPQRRAVLGTLALVLAAAAVFGVRVAWARASDGAAPTAALSPSGLRSAAARVGLQAEAVPVGPGSSTAATSSTPSQGATGAPEAAGSSATIVVHVVGEVDHPGVITLPVGSRVSDALEAAGGATSRADLSSINLARILVDGEQVRAPKPGEVVLPPAASGGSAPVGGSGGSGGGPVSLNSADVAALDRLPGIGPVLAQRIVQWRAQHGRFTSVDELAEVSGIGEKLLAQVRPLVTP